MRRRIPATVATLAALALATAPAAADPPDRTYYDGGCSFNSVNQRDLDGDTWRGQMYGYVVASSGTPAANPVRVTALRCELRVNWVPVLTVDDARTAGPFAVIAPTPIEYTASDGDTVSLCTYVDTLDAQGRANSFVDCGALGPTTVPPQPVTWTVEGVVEALGPVLDVVDGVWIGTVDPVVCPVLAGLGPSPAEDLVGITPEGDVYVAGSLVYDCPPYAS
jgi:hypothetical protein